MKRALLRGASAATLVVVGGLWASQAMAQDAGPAPGSAAAAASGQVIVTAQRRNEAIEHVPVAVTAFSAKQRDLLGIQTTQQLSDFTPGLSYYAIADRAYIRGIGRNTTNLSIEAGVAVYVNGIYNGANASIAQQHDSLFVGQIEVDRGPQNTLHGSNADGGTINYVSAKPTSTPYFEGRIGAANYNYAYAEAVVSGPITDNVRFRLGGNFANQFGGFFNNLIGPREGGFLAQGNSGKSNYLEAQLDAHLTDHFDAWAIASSGDYNTNFHTVGTIGVIPDYQFGAGATSPSAFYGLCAVPGHAIVHGCTGPGSSGQVIIPGSVITTTPNAGQFPGNNPTNLNIHNFIETSTQLNRQNRDLALATKLTYHFAGADLQYLGGYQQFYYHLDFGPGVDAGVLQYQVAGPPALGNLTINPSGNHTDFIEDEAFFSNELNLTSTAPGPLQWTTGLYWYHERFNQPIGANCLPNQTQIVHPVTLAFAPGPLNPSSCTIDLDAKLQYDSLAAYAQGSWQITPEWKLEGGVRYTDDHKFGIEQFRLITFDTSGPFLGAGTPAIDVTFAPGVTSPINPATGKPYPGTSPGFQNAHTGFEVRALNASWNAVTGDVTLNWQPDPSLLGYARYSRGYKTGGFSAGTVSAFPETQPEFVDAFEVGAKKTIGSRLQFNGAVFYYNFSNDQQPLGVPNAVTGTVQTLIFNIPTVRTYGVELEAVWKPIDPLVINAQYSYLNSTVTNSGGCFENAQDPLAILPGAPQQAAQCTQTPGKPVLQTLKGNELPEAPANKVSLNGIYTWNFEPGNLSLSASVIWKDKTYGSIFNNPAALAPAYTTVNLRAEFDDSQNRFNASIFVNNLFNSIGFDNVTQTQLAPGVTAGVPYDLVSGRGITAPLTVGGELQFRFR